MTYDDSTRNRRGSESETIEDGTDDGYRDLVSIRWALKKKKKKKKRRNKSLHAFVAKFPPALCAYCQRRSQTVRSFSSVASVTVIHCYYIVRRSAWRFPREAARRVGRPKRRNRSVGIGGGGGGVEEVE